jgi:ribonuclease HII
MAMAGPEYVIGVDEVGRGSLAGPVVVAVACLPRGLRIRNSKLGQLKDSKKLTPEKREAWFRYLAAHPRIGVGLARVYPRLIERMNISNAANLAAYRAFRRILREKTLPEELCRIYLDGNLYLGRKGLVPQARTVVKGDEKISAVMIASIFAKVSRDRFMRRLARKYPEYGFDLHKGYATAAHREAVLSHGASEIHRRTFLRFLEYSRMQAEEPTESPRNSD